MSMAAEPGAAPPGVGDDALLRELFQAHPDALLLVDDRGRVVRANPAASRCSATSQTELQGLGVDDLVPPDQRQRHGALRRAYAHVPRERPMGTQVELVALRKDGQTVTVEIALSPVAGLQGPHVLAAVRDVHAYPRVQQVMQRAQYSEHLAQLGRLAVDARDPQQVLDQVSASAATVLKADSAVLFLLDSDLLAFRVASGAGLMPGLAPGAGVPNRADTLPGHVARQGRAVSVPDLRREARFALPTAFADAGLSVALAVPLSDRGRVIGVFVVAARQALRFGDDELHFVESLCNLLAHLPATRAIRRCVEARAAPGNRRPAHRRHRARLQQPADHHPGQPAGAAGPAVAGGRRAGPEAGRLGSARRAPRRRSDGEAARFRAPPGAAARCAGHRRDAALAGRDAAPHAGPAHPHRGGRGRRLPGRCWPTRGSSTPHC